MPVERFRSKEAYRRNLAYRHVHHIPMTAERVIVGGRSHRVKHSRDPKRRQINARQRRKVASRSHRREARR